MLYRNLREYAIGTSKLGIGLGVISILGRTITGDAILAAPESLVKYGIFAGIGYSIMGSFALITFGWLGAKVRKDLSDGQTIGDYLRYKLDQSSYRVMICIIIFTCLISLFMQTMASSLILHLLFNIPPFFSLFCFFAFCALLAGFGGIHYIHRFSVFQVICIFATIILIPVYFFIQEGIKPVYDGIRLYHPYMLVLNNHDGQYFIITSILIGAGQIYSDMATWQRIFMLEKKKIIPSFLLSGLIWSTIPVAFSSLFMIIIFSGGFHNAYSLIVDLINKINTPFLLILFTLCTFSVIASSFSAALHALISFILGNGIEKWKHHTNEKRKLKLARWVAIILCFVFFVLTFLLKPSLLHLLFFFGYLYAALIIPIIFIIFSKEKVGIFISITPIIAMIIGYCSSKFLDEFQGIWISFFVSILLTFIYLFGKMFFHKSVQSKKV